MVTIDRNIVDCDIIVRCLFNVVCLCQRDKCVFHHEIAIFARVAHRTISNKSIMMK